MKTLQIFLAGFGGQGILFAGKYIAEKGLLEDLELSWLPSYGPEMRGGTCNCNVILSETPVGSPLILNPDILIVMNLPSYEKFAKNVVPGGQIYMDSSLIDVVPDRTDVEYFPVPATTMAREAGIPKLANMILVGNFLKNCPELCADNADAVLEAMIPQKKLAMLDDNRKALHLGLGYEG